MKKSVSLLIAALMFGSLAPAQPAHAFAGFLSGNVAVAALGFVIAVGPIAHRDFHGKKADSISIAAMIVGGVIMEGEQGQKLKFVPISAEQSAEIGLAASENAAYNAEIAELNQVYEAVTSDLDSLENPSIADSAELWKHYEGAVSPEALSGARKIVSKLVSQE